MAKLTENQNKIIAQLKKEFEQINATMTPISSGLIDVARIKNDVTLKLKFKAECNAERAVFDRMVSKAVSADAEKLRADLNELGLDVLYKKDGFCISSFNIVKKGSTDSLLYISYESKTYIERQLMGEKERINKSYLIRFDTGNSIFDRQYVDSIEEVAKHSAFKKHLTYIYEKANKV